MAITTLTPAVVPIIVRSILAGRGADVSNLRNNRIIAAINTALETMAYRVARGPDYRGLQKEISAVPNGGLLERVADLGTGTIFDMARSVIRDTVTNITLTPVDSYYVLTQPNILPLGQVYYAAEGADIRFRHTDGALNSYGNSVEITANFIPLLSQVPTDYHGLFFNTLIGILTEPRTEPRALELSEVGRA